MEEFSARLSLLAGWCQCQWSGGPDPNQVFSIFSYFYVFSLSGLCCFGGGLPRPQSVRAHARTCAHTGAHDPAFMFY
jgi:hypothetical protein